MNESTERRNLARYKGELARLGEQLADLDFQISALASDPGREAERSALSDKRAGVLRGVREGNAKILATREALIALLVTDARKKAVVDAQAALAELRAERAAIEARRGTAETRQALLDVDAELNALAPRLQAAAWTLTFAREQFGRWRDWAHSEDGLRTLNLL